MATPSLLGSATFNTTSGTHTVVATPVVGDLIVIIVANSGSTSSIAPTDNNAGGGGTYSLINSSVKATSADTMRVYVRNALITSATSTTFTQAPGTTTGGGLAVLKVTGMTLTGASAAIRSAIQSNQAAAGTPAPVLGATPNTNNPIIAAVFNATSPATMTPRTGYTEALDLGYSTPTTGLEVMFRASGETSATITWGNTSASAFCSIAVELNVSTAPTVALNAPVDTGTVGSTTPQLTFTGTDAESDPITYEVQIDSVNTFDSSPLTPSVVQRANGADNNGVGGSVSATFGSNTTAGNAIVVAVAVALTAATGITTPTDTQGNTYTQLGSDFTDGTHFVSQRWFIAYNTVGGANVVTVNPDPGATNLHVWEVANVVTSSALDKSASAIATSGTALSSGATATTTVAKELLLAAFGVDANTTYTVGGSFTNGVTVANTGFSSFSEDMVVSATGAYTATATAGVSNTSQSVIMTLKAAGAPSIDKVSVSDTGFVDITNGAHTDPFTSGEQIGYTVQSALTQGNTYYWRVRGKDPAGSNTYGAWATTRSFVVASTVTKTQTAIARIAVTVTKTQTAISRIANVRTKTQTATANITNVSTLTKTQTAIARIAINATKTQTAIARIANARTKTQTAISRIARAVTKTQTAIARTQATVTKTQAAIARIQKSLTKTQPAISRISNSKTKLQTAISRISQSYTKTQPAVARLSRNKTKTQTATAHVMSGGFTWKGYYWYRRNYGGDPMYNGQWLTTNVSAPDGNDYVTLSVSNPTGSSPYGGEMYSDIQGWGYGTYICVVGTRLDNLDPNFVWGGMFTYDDTTLVGNTAVSNNEIDANETSKWAGTVAATGYNHFWNNAGVKDSVDDTYVTTSDAVTTHRMIWRANRITYESFVGTGTSGQLIASAVQTTHLPTPAQEMVFFNAWVVGGGTPGDIPATSVVLRDFTFTPLDSSLIQKATASIKNNIEQLRDDFSTTLIDDLKWTNFNNGTNTSSQSTGKLVFNTTTTAAYSGYQSQWSNYSLVGSFAQIELVNAGNQALTSLEVLPINLVKDASNSIWMQVTGNTLYAYKKVAGVTTSLATVAYNNTNQRFIRIRESAGTIYFEYGPTAAGAWTALTTLATPFTITDLQLQPTVGTYNNEASGTSVTFDNVNIVPFANSKTQQSIARIAKTVTKTQPATARIAIAKTKTQTAISRISKITTKTQPATARVARKLTKTQTATARILPQQTKTQTATARIVNIYLGGLWYWDGANWVSRPIKIWNGSAWVIKPLKRWDGTQWRRTEA